MTDGRAVAAARASLARIETNDHTLRSCILVRREALADAAVIDESLKPGPLVGWTVGVKDNTDVIGTIRSDGLDAPWPFPAAADAVSVARLRAAGAVVVAKTNLEQLSFGATTQNPTWGACRNPWDVTRIPGGSSGGSAVAVAAGLVDVGLGTDTGGSLRNPAAFCGVSTLRPTHGLVPTAGVTALSPSMDTVGPLARRVAQLTPILGALTGTDGALAEGAWRGVVVGVPRTYFVDDLDVAVAAGFDELLAILASAGASLAPVTLAGVADVPDPMSALQNAEAAVYLRAYWDDERLSAGIRDRLNLGRSFTGSELRLAARVIDRWRETVEDTLAEVDVIVTPTVPFVAPKAAADDLVALSRRINRFTGCWSPTGTPVLGLPIKPSVDGLPVGAQMIAARSGDWRLLALGTSLQSITDWHDRVPRATT